MIENIPENMQYSFLVKLRNEHPAWRLLASEQCSFVAAFLYHEFMAKNQRAVPEDRLLEDLSNFIYDLHDNAQAVDIIRPAKDYLASWTDGQHSWLRKFFVNKNEACYDLTAAAQRGIEWLVGLKKQSFIGTESRVRLVFNLMREIDQASNVTPQERIAQLKAEQEAIQQEINRLEQGGSPKTLNEVQIKDRYIHAAETARSILADFREVEENFRDLERSLMEQIVTWKKGKGELLEKFFQDRDYIQHSEQGRSFGAFWDYLMNQSSREEMDAILGRILSIEGIDEVEKQYDMRHIRRQWSEAARQVMDTVSNLSRQIRQYVDEGYLEQERYIYELIQQVEDKAITIKDKLPREAEFTSMDQAAPEFDFIMDRPLFVPPKKPVIAGSALEKGNHQGSVEALFRQVYVDRKVLEENIAEVLKDKEKATLTEVLAKHPLTKGLTELLSYLVIASGDSRSFVEGQRQQLDMANVNSVDIQVDMDKVIFYRKGEGEQ
ncbi:hypothetical protein D081_0699 [Anaerovibrio sp. JC8]|uniref:DUF3375 domain-containing protein n=1 Tax=Anaerovibrio sp. JC8 TaxID=1240085 RepID=UPI000A0ACBF2|nr:DUF3375 domain-containing protein [Anaerovibrio sp. JC8]ORU00717.1 hypothetical protein D081_0699 [Anaerovibrio sp. JC8]